MKTISELNSHWWWRLVKIIYGAIIIFCIAISAIYFYVDISSIPKTRIPITRNQIFLSGNILPEIIYQITSDIMAGMKPTDIEKNYPEMRGQDLSIFKQLASDIVDGMPTSQAPGLYPEIFTQEAIDWSNKNIKDTQNKLFYKSLYDYLLSMIGICLIADIFKRLTYYVILGKSNPPN